MIKWKKKRAGKKICWKCSSAPHPIHSQTVCCCQECFVMLHSLAAAEAHLMTMTMSKKFMQEVSWGSCILSSCTRSSPPPHTHVQGFFALIQSSSSMFYRARPRSAQWDNVSGLKGVLSRAKPVILQINTNHTIPWTPPETLHHLRRYSSCTKTSFIPHGRVLSGSRASRKRGRITWRWTCRCCRLLRELDRLHRSWFFVGYQKKD